MGARELAARKKKAKEARKKVAEVEAPPTPLARREEQPASIEQVRKDATPVSTVSGFFLPDQVGQGLQAFETDVFSDIEFLTNMMNDLDMPPAVRLAARDRLRAMAKEAALLGGLLREQKERIERYEVDGTRLQAERKTIQFVQDGMRSVLPQLAQEMAPPAEDAPRESIDQAKDGGNEGVEDATSSGEARQDEGDSGEETLTGHCPPRESIAGGICRGGGQATKSAHRVKKPKREGPSTSAESDD